MIIIKLNHSLKSCDKIHVFVTCTRVSHKENSAEQKGYRDEPSAKIHTNYCHRKLFFKNTKLRCFLFPKMNGRIQRGWLPVGRKRLLLTFEGQTPFLNPQNNNPKRQALWEKAKV